VAGETQLCDPRLATTGHRRVFCSRLDETDKGKSRIVPWRPTSYPVFHLPSVPPQYKPENGSRHELYASLADDHVPVNVPMENHIMIRSVSSQPLFRNPYRVVMITAITVTAKIIRLHHHINRTYLERSTLIRPLSSSSILPIHQPSNACATHAQRASVGSKRMHVPLKVVEIEVDQERSLARQLKRSGIMFHI
jgi:hypothetical protein